MRSSWQTSVTHLVAGRSICSRPNIDTPKNPHRRRWPTLLSRRDVQTESRLTKTKPKQRAKFWRSIGATQCLEHTAGGQKRKDLPLKPNLHLYTNPVFVAEKNESKDDIQCFKSPASQALEVDDAWPKKCGCDESYKRDHGPVWKQTDQLRDISQQESWVKNKP